MHIQLLHTSASLTINENWDPDVRDDMEMMLNRSTLNTAEEMSVNATVSMSQLIHYLLVLQKVPSEGS